MKVRRVLVANADGISRVIEDGEPPRSFVPAETPDFAQTHIWYTPPAPSLEYSGEDPTTATATVLPRPGGTSCVVLTLPPDAVYASPGYDPAKAAAETVRNDPEFAQVFDQENPGMHSTPTIDYLVVLDGEVWLELTDGEVHLTQGTVVVQHGTRHAWRNRSDKPVTMLAVLVGAHTST